MKKLLLGFILAAIPTIGLAMHGNDLSAQNITVNTLVDQPRKGTLKLKVSGGVPPYTFNAIGKCSHGNIVIEQNGTFIYTPFYGWEGSAQCRYRVTDTAGDTATGIITINVNVLGQEKG